MTGANFLLETGERAAGETAMSGGEVGGKPMGSSILIDCGLIQGERVAQVENRDPFPYNVSQIDALFVTHAHLDHVGRIPKLVKDGYAGPIYSTPETRDLAELVLYDAVGILDIEARQEGVLPLYEKADVDRVLPLWKTIPYHEETAITADISVYLKDAGHILGSSMIEVRTAGKKILFTGDLGNSPSPLLRDTEEIGDVDYIVMESVYGDRNHEPKEERVEKLEKIVNDTLKRGGTVVIPAFSVDRTQVFLYELNNMVEEGRIPQVPVFVDSPMATRATEVYSRGTELFNTRVRAQIARGDDIFKFPHLVYSVSQEESRGIGHMQGSKIILAGSGMSVGGRVIKHEENFLPDPKNTILLVGYQTTGSLGRQLADGANKVTINGRKVHVKAHVETLYGFSAHKDSNGLVELVSTAGKGLKKVFVVMGEPGSSMHLAQRLNDELAKNAIVPERNKAYLI